MSSALVNCARLPLGVVSIAATDFMAAGQVRPKNCLLQGRPIGGDELGRKTWAVVLQLPGIEDVLAASTNNRNTATTDRGTHDAER